MSVSTSYIYKGKVKDPRYMQNKKDSRISLQHIGFFKIITYILYKNSNVTCYSHLQVADGKPANKFAFNSRPKTKNFTVNVLREVHQQWCTMMASKKEVGSDRIYGFVILQTICSQFATSLIQNLTGLVKNKAVEGLGTL